MDKYEKWNIRSIQRRGLHASSFSEMFLFDAFPSPSSFCLFSRESIVSIFSIVSLVSPSPQCVAPSQSFFVFSFLSPHCLVTYYFTLSFHSFLLQGNTSDKDTQPLGAATLFLPGLAAACYQATNPSAAPWTMYLSLLFAPYFDLQGPLTPQLRVDLCCVVANHTPYY